MKMNQVITEIEKSYYNHFPHSKIFVRFSKNLYPSISINCYLTGDKTENSGNYWDNDILHISFMVSSEGFKEFSRDITLESDLTVISLEANHKSYMIKPDSPYMAYGSRKLSFRKTEGNPEKIIKSLDDFFAKLKSSLLEDLRTGNIHKDFLDVVKSKLS